jgi:hypothetical protein
MIDYVKLGAAAAEYRDRCRQVDAMMAEAREQVVRDAFAALLRGDTAERDRLCRGAERLPEAAWKAKREIGLRIGERLGIDRDARRRRSGGWRGGTVERATALFAGLRKV